MKKSCGQNSTRHGLFLTVTAVMAVFAFFTAGCMEKGNNVNTEPANIVYFGTYTINDYITLAGAVADGNPGATSTPYDLNFYFTGSSSEIGLRGGFFDANGVRAYLKVTDIGEKKYEIVDYAPDITGRDSYYQNVSCKTIHDGVESDEITLLKLNHVYGVYKWSPNGGNYAKMIIDEIDGQNAWIKIRSTYQVRQGYNRFY